MKNPKAENFIEKFGVRWKYDPQFKLSSLNKEACLRNQARIGAPLENELLESYQVAMELGDEFPAIIVYESIKGDYVTIDGNHRFMAALEAGRDALDAYIVEIDGNAAVVAAMTASANAEEGQRESTAARVEHALYLVKEFSFTMAKAAELLKLSSERVSRAFRVDTTAKRLLRLQLDPTELSPSHLVLLHTLSDDDVLKSTTNVAQKFGLTTDDLKHLLSELDDFSTKETRLHHLETFNRKTPLMSSAFKKAKVRDRRYLFDLLRNLLKFLQRKEQDTRMLLANPEDLKRLRDFRLQIVVLLDSWIENIERALP